MTLNFNLAQPPRKAKGKRQEAKSKNASPDLIADHEDKRRISSVTFAFCLLPFAFRPQVG
jgi:hypothetical protein